MHHHYEDILDRIDTPPTWFDEQGVPRYGAFSPKMLGNIYAREAALAEITCQSCGHPFSVGMDGRYAKKGLGLCDLIRLGRLHYGDPPNIRCCDDGPTMNSVMHGVVEYWLRDTEFRGGWERDPTYEGPVTGACQPADIVSEVLAAVTAGHTAIRVECTSSSNRYDVAGRITAAMAERGRVLVTYPMHLVVVAGHMLDGLLSRDAIGHGQQPAPITLVSFEQLPEVLPGTMDTVIVLAGIPSWKMHRQTVDEKAEQLWRQTKIWLDAAAMGGVLIEVWLAGRRRVIESPDLVVDGWQMRAATA